jgi:maltooligosyltrehalose trehalohydrolase
MLFQGQEFAASAPFLFFADHAAPLARAVRKGRREFLKQFPGLATPEMQAQLADPAEPSTFERSKLDLGERARHAEAYRLHTDLLRLRRDDGAFGTHAERTVDGAVLGDNAFVLRFFADDHSTVQKDRLLIVNLGHELILPSTPEPLLAPPDGGSWRVLWSSEDVHYGGSGIAPVETDHGWRLPGEAAVALGPA